jgi:hypothetical protein
MRGRHTPDVSAAMEHARPATEAPAAERHDEANDRHFAALDVADRKAAQTGHRAPPENTRPVGDTPRIEAGEQARRDAQAAAANDNRAHTSRLWVEGTGRRKQLSLSLAVRAGTGNYVHGGAPYPLRPSHDGRAADYRRYFLLTADGHLGDGTVRTSAVRVRGRPPFKVGQGG